MSELRQKLIDEYCKLLEMTKIELTNDNTSRYEYISNILLEFMNSHDRVAIYCFGKHTRMLMGDFIFELKNIVAIIDNGIPDKSRDGFKIIHDEDIENEEIDGVIISSCMHMDEIKANLEINHPNVSILDIYQKMRDNGINFVGNYYSDSPHESYKYLNRKKIELYKVDKSERENLVWDIIREYIRKKEFRLAISEIIENDIKNNGLDQVLDQLGVMYELELEAISHIKKDNVLLICFDGLRRCDLTKMSKISNYFDEYACIYSNVYSYSTSTYESLVPAFSENTDQKTGYFKKQDIPIELCRFAMEAKKQGRKIYIYGDGHHFIEADYIKYSGNAQTITEKIWDLLLDALAETEGLFYLHESYESHYSFVNPYTKEEIIADSRAMLFDYLPWMGGALRADYQKQLEDSLRYLDDTFEPIIKRLKCRQLYFADHGNLLLDKRAKLSDVTKIDLTAAEGLIQIPFVVISPEYPAQKDESLLSLLDLNDFVISLLKKERTNKPTKRKYIKIGRSELYNPDFIYIYKKKNEEHSLLAFEGFVFNDKKKILVFSDGVIEGYDCESDKEILDDSWKKDRFSEVKDEITIFS